MPETVTYLSSGGKIGDVLRAVRPSILAFHPLELRERKTK